MLLSIVSGNVCSDGARTRAAAGRDPNPSRRTPVTTDPVDPAHPVRVAVYGSCVARDTVDLAGPENLEVVAYIARQSLLSAEHDASPRFPAEVSIDSDFQRRM